MIDRLLPVASVVIIFLARVVELRAKRETVPGRVQEHLTFRLFFAIGVFMIIGSLVEFHWRNETLRWPTFTAGWICAITSFAIRRRAIAALGKLWSLHVEIRENHEFVRSGPFRWVRHPTYLSMILELLSAGLILNAVLTLLILPFVFVPALRLRLQLEEGALIEKFGDAYRDYQLQTPALFPYRWPRKQ